MPSVVVLSRPKGFPSAITQSPTSSAALSPSGGAAGRTNGASASSSEDSDATSPLATSPLARHRTSAMSVRASTPTTSPGTLRPSARVTRTTPRPLMTCALVTIKPFSESITKPHPWPWPPLSSFFLIAFAPPTRERATVERRASSSRRRALAPRRAAKASRSRSSASSVAAWEKTRSCAFCASKSTSMRTTHGPTAPAASRTNALAFRRGGEAAEDAATAAFRRAVASGSGSSFSDAAGAPPERRSRWWSRDAGRGSTVRVSAVDAPAPAGVSAAVLAVAARGVHSCISAEAVVTNDAASAARHRGGQVAVDSLALVDGSVSGQTRGRKPVGDARGTDARVGERRGRPARGATPRVWTCIALFRLPGKKVPLRMRRTRRVGRLTAQCACRRRGSGDSCHTRAAMWPQSGRRRLKPVRTSHTRSHHS